jgi:hypothetical protein
VLDVLDNPSAVSVRRATRADLYAVYELLRRSPLKSSWVPLEVREHAFLRVWGGTEDYCGYVLEDGPAVVGFLGLLFTKQKIAGKLVDFCELHSWYVKDQYRKESLRLFLPVLGLKGVTLVNHTPTRDVYDLSIKFGFQDLEKEFLFVFPFPSRELWAARVELVSEPGRIAALLGGEARQVFDDHVQLDCRHFAFTDGKTGEVCYFMIKKMRTRWWYQSFARVLYVSQRALFLRALPYLRVALPLRLGAPGLALHADFAGAGIGHTKTLPRLPSLIKSRAVGPRDFNPLVYNLPLLLGYQVH